MRPLLSGGAGLRPGEIVVDSFAGGGGASLGISWALGRGPDIAINHDREAIALHRANHPESEHHSEDVWHVDPVAACRGRPVGLMWLSPDCKHFSKAKGGKPVSPRVRGLAWVACRWAKAVKPRVIVLENVEEFQTWGPLFKEDHRVKKLRGKPDPSRKGWTFRKFVGRLRNLGYAVEWRELRACDFGAPTIRRRLFLIARRDGEPIVWPRPTHGKAGSQPWRTAAECIDWTIPCPSIFLTKAEAAEYYRQTGTRIIRPLAEATQRRIARGIQRYVFDSLQPFVVEYHSAKRDGDDRVAPLAVPLPTQTTANRFGLIAPVLTQRYGERKGQAPRANSVESPFNTIVPTGNGANLVSAFLAKHYGDRGQRPGSEMTEPVSTITASDHNALVTSHLLKLRGSSRQGQQLKLPLPTVTAQGNHLAEVRAFLVAYFGNEKDGGSLLNPMRTVTSRDRFGLVVVKGQAYQLVDIGMRMLVSRELYRAQGFPDSYVIDIEYDGKPLSDTAKKRMVGNSVCPPVAEAIVRAQLGHSREQERAA